MKKLKKIPEFKNQREEFEFWSKVDSTEYIDYSRAELTIFPELKPSLKSISIRLPETFIKTLKMLANKRGIPYQSLMKIYLSEKINEELMKTGT